MNSHLCHSCYKRNDIEALVCKYCGAVLKEDKEEKMISDFIRALTRAAEVSRPANNRMFFLLILMEFIAIIHLSLFGLALSEWHLEHVINLEVTWYETSFLILSFLMLISFISLLQRRKSLIMFNVILIPVQIILQANFLITFQDQIHTYMIQNLMKKGINNEYIYFKIGFVAYVIFLAFVYSMITYLLLFNYQIRRCLRK